MQKEIVLEVKNLNVSLDNQVILKDLSFTVYKKDVLVIIGPNGAGKTILLRTILGLVPYKGKIKWYKKNISYLPHQTILQKQELPPLIVEDFFKLKKASKKQTIKILSEVGLDKSILKKQFNHLSVGQFQRMMIGWALVNNPKVLVLDEPTSSIDIGGEETFYTLLHKFWKEKDLTIIMVSHDLNIVWEHASNVLCLNKEIKCFGEPQEILSPESLEKIYGVKVKLYEHRHHK